MMSVQNCVKYAHAAKKEPRGQGARRGQREIYDNNISGCCCCLSSIKLAVHVINSNGFECRYIFRGSLHSVISSTDHTRSKYIPIALHSRWVGNWNSEVWGTAPISRWFGTRALSSQDRPALLFIWLALRKSR